MKNLLLIALLILFTGNASAQFQPAKEKLEKTQPEYNNSVSESRGKDLNLPKELQENLLMKNGIQNKKAIKSYLMYDVNRLIKKGDKNTSKQSTSIVYKGKIRNLRANSDSATIILQAGNVWGDGTGYQFLLDADANIYNEFVEYSNKEEDIPSSIYDKFEYKIPANADGARDTKNIILEKRESINILGGFYDFFITNPTPGKAVYIAGSGVTSGSNFEFKAGWSYFFEITYNDFLGDYSYLEVEPSSDFTHTLPFNETFETNPYQRWKVINANEDGGLWYYNTRMENPNGKMGCMSYSYDQINNGDDYIVMHAPIQMEAGKNHIKLYYKSNFMTESFEILYGTSSNVKEMNYIGGRENFTNTEWEEAGFNIDMQESGKYYFAIKATSPADSYVLSIANISIGSGEYKGTPDIELQNIILPIGGCDLSENEKIGFIVGNAGSESISSFNIEYTVNSGETKNETFDIQIDVKKTVTVYLTETFDLSELETTLNIHAKGICEGQENFANDEITGSITTRAPSSLPYENDLANEEKAKLWTPALPDTWKYSNNNEIGVYAAFEENIPLYTNCIDIKTGMYSLSFKYYGGFNFLGYILPDDFYVAIGKSGTDIETWKVLSQLNDVYTQGQFVTSDNIVFEIPEDGTYRIAFVSTGLSELLIAGLSLTATPEHDVTITDFYPNIPLEVPFRQINSKYQTNVSVRNLGSNAENVDISLYNNNEIINKQNIALEINEISDIELDTEIKNAQYGDIINLSVEAFIENDATIENNRANSEISVGNTFAWEKQTEEEVLLVGVGSNSGPINYGPYYALNNPDELTSITVGFSEQEEGGPTLTANIAVYKIGDSFEYEEYTLFRFSDALYEAEITRPRGGFATFELNESLKLEAGNYYFELQQLDDNNLGVSYDSNPHGAFFVRGNTETIGDYLEYYDSDFGNLVVRPNFKEGDPSSIGDITGDVIISYLNESRNKLIVNSNSEINSIAVYDVTGKKVYSTKNIKSQDHTINTSKYPAGIYMAQIETKAGNKTIKFTIR